MSFNDPLVNEVLEPSAASSSNAPVTRPPSLLTLVREKVASLSDDYKHKFTTGGKLSHTVSLQRIETFAGSMLGNPKAVHEANVSWVGRNVDFLVGAVGLAKIKASMERALVSMKHADCFIVPGYGDVQMTSVIGCPILGQGKSSKARRKLLGLSEPEKRRMERTLMECAEQQNISVEKLSALLSGAEEDGMKMRVVKGSLEEVAEDEEGVPTAAQPEPSSSGWDATLPFR